MRTAEENAAEFGRHERGGGWALGLLVACSVERRNGQGERQPLRDREEVKVSAAEFARRAGTTPGRVLRYLDAWDRATAKRIVPAASKLKPDDVDNYNLPEGYDWSDYFDGSSNGGNNTLPTVIDRATRDPQYRKALVDAIAEQDPDLIIDTSTDLEPRPIIADAGPRIAQSIARDFRKAVPEFDQIVSHLRRATTEITHAILLKQDGVKIVDRAEEREALEGLDRARTLYSTAVSRFTNGDEAFLEAIGIEQ